MAALRRFLAILLADLRERTRSPRFWILLAAMVVVDLVVLPRAGSALPGARVGLGRARRLFQRLGRLVLAMAYSLVLGPGRLLHGARHAGARFRNARRGSCWWPRR
jgi:hypothetical protein